MPTNENTRHSTLQDTSRQAAHHDKARLIYIGSPTDGFESAGRSYPLRGVERVEFSRARRPGIVSVVEQDVLRIELPYPWVSSHHADIEFEEGTPVLIDRGSRNGTLLEGRGIGRSPLAGGEVFEIGRSFWMVRDARVDGEHRSALDSSAGAHPGYSQSLRALERLAPSPVPILLVGESGVGKDFLADSVHRASGREGPLVRINIAARPIESLLSEASKGIGGWAKARGGTLVLDEVGELTAEDQSRLLSTLLSHLPDHTNSARLDDDDIKLVCLSNRDLRAMVTTEGFRPDLYARIAGYECHIPPLRERREDLGLLTRRLARDEEGGLLAVAVETFRAVLGYDWPFNVRQLGNFFAGARALVEGGEPIDAEHFRCFVAQPNELPNPSRIASVRQTLVRALAQHRGDKAAVASSLRCEVADIDRWLERFGIGPEAYAS